ncbi:MAG: endolytic transglycosylase MltG [Brevinematales bacterium]|nr:endolytic transglycosylase MltG [Brevinematales bacterium]
MPKTTLPKYLFITLVVILVVIFSLIVYITLFDSSEKPYKEYILVVEKGDNLHIVADKLYNEGIIDNKDTFLIISRILGVDRKLIPSAYKLNSRMSVFDIADIILNEKIYTIKVRIPEGATSFDIDRILSETGLTKRGDIIKVTRDQNILKKYNVKFDRLEGFLFPSTYYIPFYYKDKPERIVEIFVNTFFKKIDRDEYTRLANKVGLTFEQAIILASIIEKEAGRPKEEKYLVSSVFHNRMKRNISLGSCATVIYGLMDLNMWRDNNLKKWHLSHDTPYNTYTRRGLPKTPISNPSLESIRAAVMPYNTDYLYFVSRNDGTHIFSKTYQEHQKYVNIYQVEYWKYKR